MTRGMKLICGSTMAAVAFAAWVPGLAQARSNHRAAAPASVVSRELVKHKGGKTYEYCGSSIGCTAELVVYNKTKTFEWNNDENTIVETGTFEVKKVGKKKVTYFTTTSEYDNGCVEVGVKTKTGYNTEAEQGEFQCNAGGETWYAKL